MTTTRSASEKEKIDKLEADQQEVRGKIGKMQDQMDKMRGHMGGIEATLAVISRTLAKLTGEGHSASSDNGSGCKTKDKHENANGTGENSSFQSSNNSPTLPSFNGDDPVGWVARAEQQFEMHNLTDERKISAAFVSMEGPALYWATWIRKRKPDMRWTDFTQAIVARFDDRFRGNCYERMAEIKQTGTVGEYITNFVQAASQIPGLKDEQYLGYFTAGLKEEIKSSLRCFRPPDLEAAMDLARDIEVNLAVRGGGSIPVSYVRKPEITSRTFTGSQVYNGSAETKSPKPVGSNAGSTASTNGRTEQSAARTRFTRLSPRTMEELRAKGLCYKCKKPYSPNHDCPFKQLRVMMAEEGEEFDIPHLEYYDVCPEEEGNTEFNTPGNTDLPIYSMSGIFGPKTMRLQGIIAGQAVVILIDSGASHNFISSTLACQLQLPIEDTRQFKVQLGDGRTMASEGVCKLLSIHLQGYEAKVDCHLFTLGGIDVILGVSWLATLGDIRTNWDKLTMSFDTEGGQVQLQGDPALCRNVVSLRALNKLGDVDFWALLVGQAVTKAAGYIDNRVKDVLAQYPEIFKEINDLPPARSVDHRIVLKPGTQPVSVRPYRYGQIQKDEIEKLVGEMLLAGTIQPSSSPFSSPVLLVKKKDGSWRFCVDYRELNKATVPDKYPIPIIQEMLDELAHAEVFSKIDLRSGYHQIRVAQADVHKTAFRTHSGHYEFLVMPFGLTNAPATFQSLMNDLFRPFLRKFVLVFFDDILVYSKSWKEHIEHLQSVLQILSNNHLLANRKKCHFGCLQIEYLGHIISKDGVAMDADKVRAVMDWPRPRSVREVRGFLGLTGYYRRFVRGYGMIAQALTNLLKKEASVAFQWTEEAESSFQHLKKAMTQAPVLAMPRFDQVFMVECDASGTGIGAVLMQEKRPISYFSKSLSNRTLSRSAYEREMMALALAVQHWRPYLLGRHFIVRTDQRSLRHLFNQRLTTPAQQVWVAKLLGYDFSIEYKSGASNAAADALSRRNDDTELQAISEVTWTDWQDIEREQRDDDELKKISAELLDQPESHPGYTMAGERLYYKGKVVIPSYSSWIPQLLREFHSTPTGGHAGIYRTYRRLAANVFWKGMFRRVQQFVAECLVCQTSKYETLSPAGLLNPLPIPDQVWEDVSMDFITSLPKVRGFSIIMVVVDRLSKYAHFVAIKSPMTASSVADQFIQNIVRLHGLPRTIVSDRDSIFVSTFWKELFRRSGTQLKFSTAYHPETDGQTEVVNRIVETYLRCFVSDHPSQWIGWLPWAEYWYNTSYHTAAKTTPFEVVYGRSPPSIRRFLPGETRAAAVEEALVSRDELLRRLRSNLERAQAVMSRQANKHRRDVTFEVGDKVFLKLRPYRQQTVRGKAHHKLSPKFYGPFQVIEKIGAAAYRLQLPTNSRIHPVFHVSQLKRVIGDHSVVDELPDSVEVPLQAELEPEEVLAIRWSGDVETGEEQVLIKWRDVPLDDAVWISKRIFVAQYPDFHLEDKVVSQGERVDMQQQEQEVQGHIEQDQRHRLLVYSRRQRS